MTTLDELERAVERLNRAVERLSGGMGKYGFADVYNDDVQLLLSERAKLLATVERMRPLLIECLSDYGHRDFTDRYGMADRIRAALTTGEEK